MGPGRVPGAWCAPCVPNNRVARCVLCIVVVCAVCRGVWQSSPVMACAEMMGCRQARCSLSALYAISSASSVGVSHLHRQHRQHCETLQLTATTLLLLVASRDAVPVGPGTVGSPGDLLVGVKPRHRWCVFPQSCSFGGSLRPAAWCIGTALTMRARLVLSHLALMVCQ